MRVDRHIDFEKLLDKLLQLSVANAQETTEIAHSSKRYASFYLFTVLTVGMHGVLTVKME
jgi:hypothetical protein